MAEEIRVMERPPEVSYADIQKLLTRAHQSNTEKGILYVTATQSVEELAQKLECDDGVCFVAMEGDKLVGTRTVSFRKLNYWYHSGDVAIFKLVGVDPDYRRRHISSMLSARAFEEVRKHGRNVIVTDSAEENIPTKNQLLKQGFVMADYCVYAQNNFYSNVYVNWLDGCPYSKWYLAFRYRLKRFWIRLRYKPGKINRFTGKQE